MKKIIIYISAIVLTTNCYATKIKESSKLAGYWGNLNDSYLIIENCTKNKCNFTLYEFYGEHARPTGKHIEGIITIDSKNAHKAKSDDFEFSVLDSNQKIKLTSIKQNNSANNDFYFSRNDGKKFGISEKNSEYKASFNCNKANTSQELVICTDEQLSSLDLELHNLNQQKGNEAFRDSHQDWFLKLKSAPFTHSRATSYDLLTGEVNSVGNDRMSLVKKYKDRIISIYRSQHKFTESSSCFGTSFSAPHIFFIGNWNSSWDGKNLISKLTINNCHNNLCDFALECTNSVNKEQYLAEGQVKIDPKSNVASAVKIQDNTQDKSCQISIKLDKSDRHLDLVMSSGCSKANSCYKKIKSNFINILNQDYFPYRCSFDCNEISNIAEYNICMNQELSQLDVEMNHLFNAAKKLNKSVINSQIKWKTERDKMTSGSEELILNYLERMLELYRVIDAKK